jgi:hypothetical protein
VQPNRKAEPHDHLRSKERLTHTIVRPGIEKTQTLLKIKVAGKDKQGSVGFT